MSELKKIVFKLDPKKKEEQGRLVERYLKALGYKEDVEWNKPRREDEDYIYIRICIYDLNIYGDYGYFSHNCGIETFEPIPTEYQVAVAEHMASAPKELSEYVRKRLVNSNNYWEKGDRPINSSRLIWSTSVEGTDFWVYIDSKNWSQAMITNFWRKSAFWKGSAVLPKTIFYLL